MVVSQPGSLFLDGVRRAQKKDVMQLVEDGFADALAETDVDQVKQRVRAAVLLRGR